MHLDQVMRGYLDGHVRAGCEGDPVPQGPLSLSSRPVWRWARLGNQQLEQLGLALLRGGLVLLHAGLDPLQIRLMLVPQVIQLRQQAGEMPLAAGVHLIA